jgi:hypothetical protein
MQEEWTHKRDLTYSLFHRTRSIVRLLDGNLELAQSLSTIDLDHIIWVEYRRNDLEPVALIESCRDGPGQERKSALITGRLGQLADIPAFSVRWRPAEHPNPVYPSVCDIAEFFIQRWWPQFDPQWVRHDPRSYAQWLVRLRDFWQPTVDPAYVRCRVCGCNVPLFGRRSA